MLYIAELLFVILTQRTHFRQFLVFILSYSIQEWIGNAQLKAKNKEAKKLSSLIASTASDHYRASNYEISGMIYWLYTVIGAFLLMIIILLIGYFSD